MHIYKRHVDNPSVYVFVSLKMEGCVTACDGEGERGKKGKTEEKNSVCKCLGEGKSLCVWSLCAVSAQL